MELMKCGARGLSIVASSGDDGAYTGLDDLVPPPPPPPRPRPSPPPAAPRLSASLHESERSVKPNRVRTRGVSALGVSLPYQGGGRPEGAGVQVSAGRAAWGPQRLMPGYPQTSPWITTVGGSQVAPPRRHTHCAPPRARGAAPLVSAPHRRAGSAGLLAAQFYPSGPGMAHGGAAMGPEMGVMTGIQVAHPPWQGAALTAPMA